MLDAIKEALQDDNVVAGLAKPIASVVTETIAARLNAVDKSLGDKDENIKQVEEHVKRVDAQLYHMEHYSRTSSVRVTGIKEHDGEDLDRIVIQPDRRHECPRFEYQLYQSYAPRRAPTLVDTQKSCATNHNPVQRL